MAFGWIGPTFSGACLTIISGRAVLSSGNSGGSLVPSAPRRGICSQAHATTGIPLTAWRAAANRASSATDHYRVVASAMQVRSFNKAFLGGAAVACRAIAVSVAREG